MVTQPFVKPVHSTPPEPDVTRLKAHVQYLSIGLYPRSFDQLHKLDLAAQYIYDELKSTGGYVSTQKFSVQEAIYRNVIVRFGPEEGEAIVIGAHYDSHSDTFSETQDRRGYSLQTHTPGADDNASGVAGLLELARLIGKTRPTQPIELVAYTLEEPPHFRTEHMGSAWHVRMLNRNNRKVAYMLSLEMIGYFSDEPGSQHYPFPFMSHLYSDRGDFIALVGNTSNFGLMRRLKAAMAGATSLPVHSINAPPVLQGIDFSDHLNYWHAGHPAFMVTDTAFMRNQHYHQPGDTLEKLDYQRMGKVVQGVYAAIQQYQKDSRISEEN